MRKCDYCGQQTPDEASRCASCGTEFLVPTARLPDFEPRPLNVKKHLLACCGVYPKDQPRRKPYFLILALLAPFLGHPLARLIVQKMDFGSGDGAGFAAFACYVWLVLCAMILGGVAALVGLARAERSRGMGWLGLVMNFGLVLLFFVYTWTR